MRLPLAITLIKSLKNGVAIYKVLGSPEKAHMSELIKLANVRIGQPLAPVKNGEVSIFN